MDSSIPCIGCGEPLFGSPCRWCTCERCGNDIHNGSCLSCCSSDLFSYDQNSFNNFPNFSNYPSHSYEQESYNLNFNDASYHNTPCVSCEFCGGPHQGFECQTGNTFVYEQFSGNTQNFQNDQTPYYSTIQSQQSYCCEYCGGPHFSSDCQTGNSFPCNNHDSYGFDQPLQYQPIQATPQETDQDCF